MTDTGPTRPVRPSPAAWAPLVVLLVLFGAVLVWLLVPGTRLFPPVTPEAVGVEEAERVAQALNASLVERRATLQAALEGAQCRADGTLVLPGGLTMEGLLPPIPGAPDAAPGSRTEGSLTPALPAPVERTVAPGTDSASLIELIEARTVMVVAPGDPARTGSGFFVAPDLVVTNHHVIEAAGPGGVFVTSRGLGSLRPATVVTTRGPFQAEGVDFALLRVPGATQPFFDVLSTDTTLKLQAVIAAGYPGDLLVSDRAFAALQAGDGRAIPDLSVTDGLVNTEQTVDVGTRLVVHSAPITVGSSGGPLIDYCGRVVGVNTFVRQGPMRNLNFALGSADLLRFLEAAGVEASVVTDVCQPVVLRPAVPAAAVSGDAAPSPPATP